MRKYSCKSGVTVLVLMNVLLYIFFTLILIYSRGYFVTLNLFLILMGLLRPIWLFHDPYNSKNTWHRAGAYLLVDTGFPCITTAFAVLFLALLRATQVTITRYTLYLISAHY